MRMPLLTVIILSILFSTPCLLAQTLLGEIEGAAVSDRTGATVVWGHYQPVVGPLQRGVGIGSPGAAGGAGMVDIQTYLDVADTWVVVRSYAGGQPGDEFGFSLDGGVGLNTSIDTTWIVGAPGAAGETGEVSAMRALSPTPLWTTSGTSGGSRFGHAVAVIDDANGDGFDDVLVGAPEQDVLVGVISFAIDAGVARVLSGFDGSLIRSHVGSVNGGNLGEALCRVPDVDGDGVDDYAIGEPGFDVGGTIGAAGRVRVYSGATGSVLSTRTSTGPKAGARYGAALSTVDFDVDGTADIIVGAPGFDSGFPPFQLSDLGRIEVRSGVDGSALWQRNGAGVLSRFGARVLGATDFDEDGHGEVIVGSPGADGGNGRVEVFSGRTQTSLYRVDGGAGDELGSALALATPFNAPVRWTAGRPGASSDRGGISWWSDRVDWNIRQDRALMGTSVALLGDVDGDGIDDFAASEYDPDLTLFIPIWRIFSGRTSAVLHGEGVTTTRGFTLADLADVNGDGTRDLAVARPGDGIVEVRSGSDPAVTLATLADGPSTTALFGHAMAGVGDLDGDGIEEIAVGAPRHGAGGPGAGRVTVFSGLGGPPLFTHDGNSGDALGTSVAGLGDVDGDGVPDYGVGAPHAGSGPISNVGRVEVRSGVDGSILFTLQGSIGIFEGSWAGFSLAGPGDVDGDGYADIAIGEPRHGDDDEGRIRMVAGGPVGAPHGTLHTIVGTAIDEHVGQDLTAIGDLDRDGAVDLAWVAERYKTPRLTSGRDGSFLRSPDFFLGVRTTVAGRAAPHADHRTPLVVGRPSLSGSDSKIEFMIMPFARAIDLGGGCGGMTHPILTSTPPRFGKTFSWSVSMLTGTPQQVVYVATSLPPAAPAGLGFGCEFHVDVATMTVESFAFTGTSFVQTFVMPDLPFLSGFSLVRQAFNFDNAAPYAVALSNGELLTFGF